MGIDSTSVEKYHLRTAGACRCVPAPAHSSPENLSSIESQSSFFNHFPMATFIWPNTTNVVFVLHFSQDFFDGGMSYMQYFL